MHWFFEDALQACVCPGSAYICLMGLLTWVQVINIPHSECIRMDAFNSWVPPEAAMAVSLSHPHLVRTYKFVIPGPVRPCCLTPHPGPISLILSSRSDLRCTEDRTCQARIVLFPPGLNCLVIGLAQTLPDPHLQYLVIPCHEGFLCWWLLAP